METKPAKGTIRIDVYALITDGIIEQLHKGIVPWAQSWTDAGLPQNLVTGILYKGLNVFLLASLGYAQNVFLSYKQLLQLGAAVKKDEKGHPVIFWDYSDTKPATGEAGATEKKAPTLLYYTVYNIAQCEGIPDERVPVMNRIAFDPIASCEELVREMPQCPPIRNKEQKAYYEPLKDFVNMPKPASFESTEDYYCTLLHELVHSTGHHSRLDRPDLIQMPEFDAKPCSREELVAEIGAAYLQSHVGITGGFQKSTPYIQGWIAKLKNDRRLIFSAASAAQKAIDFILNVKGESENKMQQDE